MDSKLPQPVYSPHSSNWEKLLESKWVSGWRGEALIIPEHVSFFFLSFFKMCPPPELLSLKGETVSPLSWTL